LQYFFHLWYIILLFIWLVRFKKHKRERSNTKHFLGFPVTSNNINYTSNFKVSNQKAKFVPRSMKFIIESRLTSSYITRMIWFDPTKYTKESGVMNYFNNLKNSFLQRKLFFKSWSKFLKCYQYYKRYVIGNKSVKYLHVAWNFYQRAWIIHWIAV
jgi:hypothetical protein